MTQERFDPLDLVRAAAIAVFHMQAHHDAGYAVPYPPAAQVALDRITLACLLGSDDAPASVPALMALCRRHLSKWPFAVPADYVGPDAVLVDESTGLPTHTCAEWAFGTDDSSGSRDASSALRRLAADCPSVEIYGRCRDFLIDNPVMNQNDLRAVLAKPGAGAVWKRVQHLYGEFPAGYSSEGRCILCPSCGCPAIGTAGKPGWCESGVCPDFPVTTRHPVSALCALPRELRSSLSTPGQVEREVREACAAAGGRIDLVPGPVDHLRISWPSGDVWFLVIRTDSEPALLAQRLRSWTPLGAERVVVAVPDRVIARRADYREVFDRYRGPGSSELMPVGLVVPGGQSRNADGGQRHA